MRAALFGAATFLLICAAMAAGQVTLYRNGNIYTVDPAQPRAEAMVVEGARLSRSDRRPRPVPRQARRRPWSISKVARCCPG